MTEQCEPHEIAHLNCRSVTGPLPIARIRARTSSRRAGASATAWTLPAKNILSSRLSRLVERGILERWPPSRPQTSRYRLTAKGRDLYPVALAMMQWADRWVTGQSTTRPVHRDCGRPLEVVVRCSRCGMSLAAHEASYEQA